MQAVSLFRSVEYVGRAVERVAETRRVTDADGIDAITSRVAGAVMDLRAQFDAVPLPATASGGAPDDRPAVAAFVAVAAERGRVTESALVRRGADPTASDAVAVHDGTVVLPLGRSAPYRGNWPYVLRPLADRLPDLVRRGRRVARRIYADRTDRSPLLGEQWERIADLLASVAETAARGASLRTRPELSSIDRRIASETTLDTETADDRQ